MHCHLHRGDWSFHLTNERKKKKTKKHSLCSKSDKPPHFHGLSQNVMGIVLIIYIHVYLRNQTKIAKYTHIYIKGEKTDRQTDSHTGRETGRRTDRQTDRQTDSAFVA